MEFNKLEILILLRCWQKPITKKNLTQYYWRYTKEVRDDAITHLISKELLMAQELPKPGVRKTPTIYSLTEKGKQWVEEYMVSYPV